jgi:hypothetical protein
MYTNRRHVWARVSDVSIMRDTMTEMRNLCVTVLRTDASQLCVSPIVLFAIPTTKHPTNIMAHCTTINPASPPFLQHAQVRHDTAPPQTSCNWTAMGSSWTSLHMVPRRQWAIDLRRLGVRVSTRRTSMMAVTLLNWCYFVCITFVLISK